MSNYANGVIDEAATVIQFETKINEDIQEQIELREDKESLMEDLKQKLTKFNDIISYNYTLQFNSKLRNNVQSSVNNSRQLAVAIYKVFEESHLNLENIGKSIESTKQALQEEKIELNKLIDELKSQKTKETEDIIREVKEEQQELLNENNMLKEELNRLTKEYQHKCIKNKELELSLVSEECELKNQIKLKGETKSELCYNINELETELSQLQNESVESELKELQERTDEHENKLELINTKLEGLENENITYDQQILETQSKETAIINEINIYKTNIDKILEDINNLKNIENECLSNNNKVKEIKAFIKSEEKHIEELAKEKNNIISLISESKQDIDTINIQAIHIELNDLEIKLQNCTTEFEKSTTESEKIENETTNYNKEIDLKEIQLQELAKMIKDEETHNIQKKQNIQKVFTKELEPLDEKAQNTENETKDKQAIVNDLECQLEKEKLYYNEVLKTATSLEDKTKQFNTEINTLKVKECETQKQINVLNKKTINGNLQCQQDQVKQRKLAKSWDSDSSVEGQKVLNINCFRRKKSEAKIIRDT